MTPGEMVDVGLRILVALGGLGGVAGFLMVRAQKRKVISESTKTDAEADSILADASGKRTDREGRILDMYERGMNSMQERLDDAEAKIDRLTNYVEVLVGALRAAGQPVPPMPKQMTESAHQGELNRGA